MQATSTAAIFKGSGDRFCGFFVMVSRMCNSAKDVKTGIDTTLCVSLAILVKFGTVTPPGVI